MFPIQWEIKSGYMSIMPLNMRIMVRLDNNSSKTLLELPPYIYQITMKPDIFILFYDQNSRSAHKVAAYRSPALTILK